MFHHKHECMTTTFGNDSSTPKKHLVAAILMQFKLLHAFFNTTMRDNNDDNYSFCLLCLVSRLEAEIEFRSKCNYEIPQIRVRKTLEHKDFHQLPLLYQQQIFVQWEEEGNINPAFVSLI